MSTIARPNVPAAGVLVRTTRSPPIGSATPAWFRARIVSVVIPNSASVEGEAEMVVALPAAANTVIVAVPVADAEVAVIVVVPSVSGVTTPVLASTLATDGLLDVHATAPPIVRPTTSRTTAPSACVVPPACNTAIAGVTAMYPAGKRTGALT